MLVYAEKAGWKGVENLKNVNFPFFFLACLKNYPNFANRKLEKSEKWKYFIL